jgi:hypothetical protein
LRNRTCCDRIEPHSDCMQQGLYEERNLEPLPDYPHIAGS